MTDWEFDPEELDRLKAQQSAQKKPTPAVTPSPAPPSTLDLGEDFLDSVPATPAAPAASEGFKGLVSEEAQAKAKEATSQAKAKASAAAALTAAKSKALWMGWVANWHSWRVKRAIAAQVKAEQAELRQRNREAARAQEAEQGLRAPVVIDLPEQNHTPTARQDLFSAPNPWPRRALSAGLVALVAAACWMGWKHFVPSTPDTVPLPGVTDVTPKAPTPAQPTPAQVPVETVTELPPPPPLALPPLDVDSLPLPPPSPGAPVVHEAPAPEPVRSVARQDSSPRAAQPAAPVKPPARAKRALTAEEEEAKAMEEQMKKLDSWGQNQP